MEESGYLRINDPHHLFVLHHVFLPRINVALTEFQGASNLRPVRTENNWTPERMWANGRAACNSRDAVAAEAEQELAPNVHLYGIDLEGPNPLEDHGSVELNEVQNPLPPALHQQLITAIDPLRESQHFGIDIYLHDLEVFNTLV